MVSNLLANPTGFKGEMRRLQELMGLLQGHAWGATQEVRGERCLMLSLEPFPILSQTFPSPPSHTTESFVHRQLTHKCTEPTDSYRLGAAVPKAYLQSQQLI